MNLCLVQLILSNIYVMGFLMAVIYMLTINRCKFNKRTKVIIITLAITMCLQLSSAAINYNHELKDGECTIVALAYTLLSE